MSARKPLRYDALSRLKYLEPRLPSQKLPAWSCPVCPKDNNFACRLECACGHRPGKSHEDKAWQSYRKGLAVPLPNHGQAKTGPAGNAWERQGGASNKGKVKPREPPSKADKEWAKLQGKIVQLQAQISNNDP